MADTRQWHERERDHHPRIMGRSIVIVGIVIYTPSTHSGHIALNGIINDGILDGYYGRLD